MVLINVFWTALGDISANIIQGTMVIFVLGSFFLDNPDFFKHFKMGRSFVFILSCL